MRILSNSLLCRACVCILFGLIMFTTAHAGDVVVAFDSGNARLTDSRYESATINRVSGGYAWDSVSVTASYYAVNDFQLKADKGAKISLTDDIGSVQAYWNTRWLGNRLDLGAGLFRWKLRAKYNRSIYGENGGTSPMVEARLSRLFTPVYGMYLSGRYVRDIEDEDMLSLSFGVRLSF